MSNVYSIVHFPVVSTAYDCNNGKHIILTARGLVRQKLTFFLQSDTI